MEQTSLIIDGEGTQGEVENWAHVNMKNPEFVQNIWIIAFSIFQTVLLMDDRATCMQCCIKATSFLQKECVRTYT